MVKILTSMSTILFWYGGLGFVIPRIVLGALLVVHGWPKVKDLRQNVRNFSGMGFKPGVVWGTISALLEFLGGIGFILGLWMIPLCFLFMGEFAVIILWKWFKKMPFVSGWEMDALIFVTLLIFFTLYGGFFLFASARL